jgi:spoIIIJ-associated protein
VDRGAEARMQEIERSGASVEEAIEAALQELGISEQEAEIQVLQEPRAGFLRLNSQPALVRVRARADTSVTPEAAEGQADVVLTFLEGLADVMGIDVDMEANVVGAETYVDIWGVEEDDEDVGLLIGKGGHTVEALQELVRCHVHRETGERCSVLVDVEDYRKRRRAQIVKRAREAARRVQRDGKPESLQPMSAYERKLVHDTVAAVGGLETSSEGEEPQRFVVIRRG